MSQKETLNGAQLAVRLLERQGIRRITGIPGGAILPFYDALSQSQQISHILARHEQGAGFMAQGAARVSGEVAVCAATSGPGVMNLLTAIADARLDSIPLVAITGQVASSLIGTDAFQEVDTYGMTVPITKHNYLVSSAADLLWIIPRAFSIAASGRPGPVVVDIPKDVLLESVDIAAWPAPGVAEPMPEICPARLDAAAAMINKAARPMLYLGGGVINADAAAIAIKLAEKAALPTVMSLMALGAMPPEHPLYLGMLGMHGARYTNLALDECDLLVVAGARFDDRATGRVAQFCPQAKIIHIDIDPAELDKIKAADIAVCADVKLALACLLAQVQLSERKDWQTRIAWLKAEQPLRLPGSDNPRSPYGLIRAVAACLDDEAIIVTDVGQHQMWVAQAYPLRRPRQWLTSGGLGTMGFGLPTAIGAAMAQPERSVVCFSGDGSILMNIQELATAAEENVNLKVVLMNNRALGLVVQQQKLFYGERVFASEFKGVPDFIKIAAGFGWATLNLDLASDAEGALQQALSTPGPCFIHISIDPQAQVLPMVAPGGANTQMIGG